MQTLIFQPTASERAKATQLLKPTDTVTLPDLVITPTGMTHCYVDFYVGFEVTE